MTKRIVETIVVPGFWILTNHISLCIQGFMKCQTWPIRCGNYCRWVFLPALCTLAFESICPHSLANKFSNCNGNSCTYCGIFWEFDESTVFFLIDFVLVGPALNSVFCIVLLDYSCWVELRIEWEWICLWVAFNDQPLQPGTRDIPWKFGWKK